jgi:hypothetical protein
MYAILLSAIGSMFGFLLRSVIVKFVTFFALYMITSAAMNFLVSKLPDASSMGDSLGALSSGVWYFLDLFAFSQGLPMVLSAWLLRFMIRRMPVVG